MNLVTAVIGMPIRSTIKIHGVSEGDIYTLTLHQSKGVTDFISGNVSRSRGITCRLIVKNCTDWMSAYTSLQECVSDVSEGNVKRATHRQMVSLN